MEPRVKPIDSDQALEAGRRVLTIEAQALEAIAGSLDESFSACLDALDAVTGRIVITGMGKSGHVARKIAATLASTGSPAQFVHPGEASHGDLGMIASGDAVVALSNSGATAEMSAIIGYSRLRSVPLIAMTSRRDSSLAEAADIALILPSSPEACPMGLAPTTSTTMMMAMGDAIAVALLDRKGFTKNDFQVLHPGGAIGRKLVRVSEVMHKGDELPLCRPDTSMSEALLVMTEKNFGCTGVIDDAGQLIGVITDGDLRRHMAVDLLQRSVGEVMTGGAKSIRPQALAAEALGFMNNNAITRLFVVEDGQPVGIVRMDDCIMADVV